MSDENKGPGEEARRHLPEEVVRHWKTIDEIHGQTDRGAAIIAAAYLDDRLESVILEKLSATGLNLKRRGQTVRDRLIGNGPLQTFSARIDLAAAVGFLGPHAYRDAHLIRDIRNHFAHMSGPASFGDPPVVDQCAELWFPQNLLEVGGIGPQTEAWGVGPREPPTDAREQYLEAVFTIWRLLLTECLQAEWEIGSPYMYAVTRSRPVPEEKHGRTRGDVLPG